MTIQTGVYVPGTTFSPNQLQVIVGNQIPAINKGAFNDTEGKKQRMIVVENDLAKRNLIKDLCEQSSYDIAVPGVMRTVPQYQQQMLQLGRTLSDRVITCSDYNAQRRHGGYIFQKLYIEAMSQGVGSTSYVAEYQKSPPLKTATTTGLIAGGVTTAACALFGASTSTSLKVGATIGLGVFGATLVHQELEPEIKPHPISSMEMAKRLVPELQCSDVRILSYNSGDRRYPTDITSPAARNVARTTPENVLAHDEALAQALSIYPSARRVGGTVSGYQGMCGFIGPDGHLTRRSRTQTQAGMEEKSIRQKDVKVRSQVNWMQV